MTIGEVNDQMRLKLGLPVYQSDAKLSLGLTDYGVVDGSDLEKVRYAQLFIRAVVEQKTGSAYAQDNPLDRNCKAEVLDFMTHLTGSALDYPEGESDVFFRNSKDGRSYRVLINPKGEGSASNQVLQKLVEVTGLPIIAETGMVFQLKGGGPNILRFAFARSSWYANVRTPYGLTDYDQAEEDVARLLGLGEATRVPLSAFSINSIAMDSGDVYSQADLAVISGDTQKPMVLEIFANLAGYSILDINSKISDGLLTQESFWHWGMSQSAIYFSRKEAFQEILAKVRAGSADLTADDKLTWCKLLIAKLVRDSQTYGTVYSLGDNRSIQNTTLFGQQDWDDVKPVLDKNAGLHLLAKQVQRMVDLASPEFRKYLTLALLDSQEIFPRFIPTWVANLILGLAARGYYDYSILSKLAGSKIDPSITSQVLVRCVDELRAGKSLLEILMARTDWGRYPADVYHTIRARMPLQSDTEFLAKLDQRAGELGVEVA